MAKLDTVKAHVVDLFCKGAEHAVYAEADRGGYQDDSTAFGAAIAHTITTYTDDDGIFFIHDGAEYRITVNKVRRRLTG